MSTKPYYEIGQHAQVGAQAILGYRRPESKSLSFVVTICFAVLGFGAVGPCRVQGMENSEAAPGISAVAQRIVHTRPPLRWEHGFPLGNGDVGVMMWGGGEPLAFTLDKADLWDLRANTDYLSQPQYNYASLVRLIEEKRFAEVDEIFEKRQRRDNPIGPTKISIGRAELRL